jgi:hypothetical protein
MINNRNEGGGRTDTFYSIKHSHEVNLNVDRKRALEPVGHLPSFLVISFEHLVGEFDLLVVVRGE